MLVLTRERDEKIIIQPPGVEDISVTVVEVRGNKVRLGITAGNTTRIDREEVWIARKKEAADRAAASEDP